jgi:hypothetical protein
LMAAPSRKIILSMYLIDKYGPFPISRGQKIVYSSVFTAQNPLSRKVPLWQTFAIL